MLIIIDTIRYASYLEHFVNNGDENIYVHSEYYFCDYNNDTQVATNATTAAAPATTNNKNEIISNNNNMTYQHHNNRSDNGESIKMRRYNDKIQKIGSVLYWLCLFYHVVFVI